MSKQALLKRLNERLAVFDVYRPNQLVEIDMTIKLVGMIIKDVETLISAPQNDQEILAQIVALSKQLQSPTMRFMMDRSIERASAVVQGLPEPYSIEFVVDNGFKVYPDGRFSVDKISIIKKYRTIWAAKGVNVGLSEAKDALDIFLEQHEQEVIQIMADRSKLD